MNLLKWTETVGLMLGLVEDEGLAVRVVERCLGVDLMLGAKLAGKVRSTFQEKTVELISKAEVENLLNDKLSKQANFGEIVPIPLESTKYSNETLHWNVSELIVKMNTDSDITVSELFKSIEDLNDLNSEVCDIATSIASQIDSEKLISALLNAIDNSDGSVRWRSVFILGQIGSETVIPKLLKLIEYPDIMTRSSAAVALGQIGSEVAIPYLATAINDLDWGVRSSAAAALGQIGSDMAILILTRAINDSNLFVRWNIIQALGKISSDSATSTLIRAIDDPELLVRWSAANSLGKIDSDTAIAALIQIIDDSRDSNMRFGAVQALNTTASGAKITALSKAIKDPDLDVRKAAVGSLRKIGSESAILNLVRGIKDSDSYIRWITAEALSTFESDRAAHILPDLLKLLPTEFGKEAFHAIQAVQSNCKFYNYEIHQKAQTRHPAKQQSSLDTTIIHIDYIAGDKIQGDKTLGNKSITAPNATEVKIFEQVDNYHASPRDPPS